METIESYLALCQTVCDSNLVNAVVACQASKMATTLHLDLTKTSEIMVDGRHPLIEACRVGNFNIVQDFVTAGASLNILDAEGKSPLYAAIVGRNSKFSNIQQLLAWGADVNLHKHSRLPLLASLYNSSTDVSEMLILAGADVNNVVLASFCFVESMFSINSGLVIVSSGIPLRQSGMEGLVSLAMELVLAGLTPKTFYLSGEQDLSHIRPDQLTSVMRLRQLCVELGFKVDRTSLALAIEQLQELLAAEQQTAGATSSYDRSASSSSRHDPQRLLEISSDAAETTETEELQDFLRQNIQLINNLSSQGLSGNSRIATMKDQLSQLLWMQDFLSRPMPLTYLCRAAIRAHLVSPVVSRGRHIEENIQKLSVPHVFRTFLAPRQK